VLGMAVHRWKVGKYRRLWHSTHTPGHRNRRGRTTVSTQPSGGNALNWSLLHWRQWTEKKCMIKTDLALSTQRRPGSTLNLSSRSRVLVNRSRTGFGGGQP
jgi:hypothetical protein